MKRLRDWWDSLSKDVQLGIMTAVLVLAIVGGLYLLGVDLIRN